MLIRTGGGHTSRLSIPRDTLVDLPGYGPQKINAAYFYGGGALAVSTVDSFLGIKINHLIVINFTNFPALVNAMGGVNYTGGCIDSQISGGVRNGGYSLVLPPVPTISTATRRWCWRARATTSATPPGPTSRARRTSKR